MSIHINISVYCTVADGDGNNKCFIDMDSESIILFSFSSFGSWLIFWIGPRTENHVASRDHSPGWHPLIRQMLLSNKYY